MSLTAAERSRTSHELNENLRLTGLTTAQVARDLDFTVERLNSTLAIDRDSRPEDVWYVRDYLDQTALDLGAVPVPYSTLTEASRSAASGWFPLRTPPRHNVDA